MHKDGPPFPEDFFQHYEGTREEVAIRQFRLGNRDPLLWLLEDRGWRAPLSKEVYQVFIELVEGKTGRPRGRPKLTVQDQFNAAYLVALDFTRSRSVKESFARIARERDWPESFVRRSHQKYDSRARAMINYEMMNFLNARPALLQELVQEAEAINDLHTSPSKKK